LTGLDFVKSKKGQPALTIGYSDGDQSSKVEFRKGERIVGIQAHKDGNKYYNV
jgi:hypothetical protein